ncbi:thiamine-phosphate kinase [Parasphingorhabdus halotolerans]|uniref:Thiamine-monophosphate kinase n=1 Tax=Parasphingorhabdus halotolerans TaxID=2725558 RepID=A0A6H2DK88_9SPHN|nr:thiamine-phosphate kinase [Parasphingorhabdus halotolerans]QJB68161.1 thiamine-phosphate kinase [Parasphingorhabdus halotolerans]
MNELEFVEQLKTLAIHPAARGLVDDAAVLPFGRHKLVITHDMMVEGVHYLPDADPADVAWKLVAVNLSDLAAKGAKPLGILMGYGGFGDDAWDTKFIEGLKQAIARFGVPLLGGDTVGMGEGCKRAFGLTAFGEAKGHIIPARSGAAPGHAIYVTGKIGDAWAGLQIASGKVQARDLECTAALLKAHNRPDPKLEEGRALSSLVSTMMDISDGLLIDAERIAKASNVCLEIDLAKVPLSPEYISVFGDDEEARKKAATGGDDYQLLLTASPETVLPIAVTRVGQCKSGSGIALINHSEPTVTPANLGYVHA